MQIISKKLKLLKTEFHCHSSYDCCGNTTHLIWVQKNNEAFFCHRSTQSYNHLVSTIGDERQNNTYYLPKMSSTIRSDGICVSIKAYLTICCLFKNPLNSPNALSDCSVITLGPCRNGWIGILSSPIFPIMDRLKALQRCSGTVPSQGCALDCNLTASKNVTFCCWDALPSTWAIHAVALTPVCLWSFADLPFTLGHHPWHYLTPGVSVTLWSWRVCCVQSWLPSFYPRLDWQHRDSGQLQKVTTANYLKRVKLHQIICNVRCFAFIWNGYGI